MRKYGSLLLVLVLATASLLAAAAYNTATIVNAASITVSNTTSALLALNPLGGVGNKDNTARIVSGNLEIYFGIGTNPWFGAPDTLHGLQKNSEYVWEGMFSMQNRSAETIVTAIQVTGLPAGVSLYMHGRAGLPANAWVNMTDGAFHDILPLGWGSVASGSTVEVGVKIVVGSGAAFPATTALSVVVKGTAQ